MSNGALPPQPQRSSIFAGVLLIFLGALFLLHRFDPELGIGHLIGRYWPVLLIVWGIAKLVDHLSAQRTGRARPPVLSGGEAALLVLLVVVLSWNLGGRTTFIRSIRDSKWMASAFSRIDTRTWK